MQGLFCLVGAVGGPAGVSRLGYGAFYPPQALALNETAAARMQHTHLVRLGQALAAACCWAGLALVVRIPLNFGRRWSSAWSPW